VFDARPALHRTWIAQDDGFASNAFGQRTRCKVNKRWKARLHPPPACAESAQCQNMRRCRPRPSGVSNARQPARVKPQRGRRRRPAVVDPSRPQSRRAPGGPTRQAANAVSGRRPRRAARWAGRRSRTASEFPPRRAQGGAGRPSPPTRGELGRRPRPPRRDGGVQPPSVMAALAARARLALENDACPELR
jgi:hypothetical protein